MKNANIIRGLLLAVNVGVVLLHKTYGQGYFQFQGGGAPTRVGSIDGPLAGFNIVSQILAGVDGLTLTPVGDPKPNYLGIIPERNIVEVPFLNTQDTAFVRYAAWDASIWGMDYRKVPSEDVGISSLSTVFLYQKDRDAYLNPLFHGAVFVPLSVPEPGSVVMAGLGLGVLWAYASIFRQSRKCR